MNVGELVATVKVKVDNASAALDKVEKKVDKLGGKLVGIGKFGAFAGLAAGAIGFSAAIAPAAGAVLLLPAALGVAGAAMAAFKVGTSGVGDALKALADGDAAKAAEAMAKLSPNARLAVTAMNDVRTAFKGVKTETQDALFRGLNTEVAALGRSYLPILKGGLTANATALNGWAKSAAGAARSPFVTGAVANIMAQTAGMMSQNAPIAGSLVTIFAALANAGTLVVGAMLNAANGGLATAAGFLSSAQGAQWLQAKITAAINVFRQIFALVGNIISIIVSVFSQATGLGNSLLGTLIRLTGAAAAWAASAQGQQKIAEVFRLLGDVLTTLGGTFGVFASIVGTVTNIILALPAPLQSIVTGFLGTALAVGMVAPKLFALAQGLITMGSAALGVITRLPAMVAGLWAFITAIPGAVAAAWAWAASTVGAAASATGAWLASMGRMIAGGAVWVAQVVAQGAAAVASMVATGIGMAAQWTMMAARAVASAVVMAGAWLIANGPGMVAALASLVVTAIAYLVQWGIMAAGAMASAIAMAAAWFVALGPVGWIIAIVVALVALIIANWDTVVQWTTTAWNAVTSAISAAWSWIVGIVSGAIAAVIAFFVSLYVGISQKILQVKTFLINAWNMIRSYVIGVVSALVARIVSGFSNMYNAVVEWLGRALDWIGSLPGKVLAALSSFGTLLVQTGRDLVNGLWNGIKAGWDWLVGAVGDLASRLLSAAKSALGIGSPSKLFRDEVGRWLPAGVGVGITANMGPALAAMRSMSGALAATMPGGSFDVGGGGAAPVRLHPDDLRALAGMVGAELDGRPVEVAIDGKPVATAVRRQDAKDRPRGGGLAPAARGRGA